MERRVLSHTCGIVVSFLSFGKEEYVLIRRVVIWHKASPSPLSSGSPGKSGAHPPPSTSRNTADAMLKSPLLEHKRQAWASEYSVIKTSLIRDSYTSLVTKKRLVTKVLFDEAQNLTNRYWAGGDQLHVVQFSPDNEWPYRLLNV